MKSSGDTEKIGLLLVHGIGDQARYLHLQTVGDQIVKALAFEFGRHNIAVEMFPGLENPSAPIYFGQRWCQARLFRPCAISTIARRSVRYIRNVILVVNSASAANNRHT